MRSQARTADGFQTDDMRVDAKNQVSKLLRAQSPTSESPAQSYLSALERGEKEPGAAVLLAISKEFGKSVDWLLTERHSLSQRDGSPKIRPNFDSHFPITGGLRAERMGICQNYLTTMERGTLGDPASDHSEVCEKC
jgi:transcriptional regulator with XRE-family HTH domain